MPNHVQEGSGMINLRPIGADETVALNEGFDSHAGFVAGRYRNSALSDQWTDVGRCAAGTFVAYVPACSCGWSGAERPATPTGLLDCRRVLRAEHAR